jgi:hypothetical protein
VPTLTNVVEIVVKGTCATTGSGTKNIYNVFHYTWVSGAAPVSAANVLVAFLAGPWTQIAAALSSAYTGVESDTRMMDDALSQYTVGSVPASGGVAGARLPTATAVVFLLRSLTRGKSYRGSKHFGPIAEAHQTNDELNATGLGLWNPISVQLTNTVNPSDGSIWAPCVLSRVLSQTRTNPTTLVGSRITTALLNKTLGTMRHRKEKTVR